jgi:four helix bundle protein
MAITHYKDLIVWQKSMRVVEGVYAIVDQLPKTEIYILSQQALRASISIPSNISEGYARNHILEFIHFLGIALGSSAELETQLIIIKKRYPRVQFGDTESILCEVQKMLSVLIKKLKSKSKLGND